MGRVDPAGEVGTEGTGRRASWWRRLVSRPGIVESLATAIWLLLIVEDFTGLDQSWYGFGLLLVWPVLALVWMVHLVVAATVGPTGRLGWVGLASWLFLPAATIMALVLFVWHDLGLAARVALCEARLRRYAEACPQSEANVGGNVGLFYVDWAERRDDRVLIFIGGEGKGMFHGRAGLAYIPSRRLPEWATSSEGYEHLYGPWYKFSRGGIIEMR